MAPADSAATPIAYPDSVVVIGHSGATGYNADPTRRDEDATENAWATGTNPDVDSVCQRILAANPGQVEAYRGGKEGLLGFFVGQVMKESGGKANAKVVSELVRAKLSS